MSNNKQRVDKLDEKANRIRSQRPACQALTGIGGGLVGAAIGGLLGRRVGGVGGAVVGAVAGALVGKGTAVRVNRTVESVVDTALSVANAVNYNVNGVGDALKDTIESVKPSVVTAVEAAKDTVEAVKPSVVSIVSVATSVGESVNHTVLDVGNTVKDTVEVVKPSLLSVLQATKDTLEEVKRSFVDVVEVAKDTIEEVKVSLSDVGAASDVASGVDHFVQDVENPQKDIFETIAPKVVVENATTEITEEVAPSVVVVENATTETTEAIALFVEEVSKEQTGVDHNINDIGNVFLDAVEECSNDHQISKLDKPLDRMQLLGSSVEHSLKDKYIQVKQEEFTPIQPETIQPQTEKTKKFAAIIMAGAAILTCIGVTWGSSPKQKLLGTKSIETNLALSSKVEKTSEISADGWIFLGKQSTDLPVVPSVGSVVTITARSGVILSQNRPQEPDFNHQEQKALAILKPNTQVKILKVEFVKPNRTIQTATIWAEVHRCDRACN